MRKVNRILAIALTAAIIAGVMPSVVFAGTDTQYTSVCWESYDNEEKNFNSAFGYGGYNLVGASKTIKIDTGLKLENLAVGDYVETSFDVIPANASNQQFYMMLGKGTGNADNVVYMYIKNDNKSMTMAKDNLSGGNNQTLFSDCSKEDFNNIKIVMQVVDTDTSDETVEKAWKIDTILKNNVQCQNLKKLDLKYPTQEYESLRFQTKSGSAASIDNVSIVKYTKATASTVPDRYAYRNTVNEIYNDVKDVASAEAEFKTALEAVTTKYNTKGVTQNELNEALAPLKIIQEDALAFKAMGESGVNVAVVAPEAKEDGKKLEDFSTAQEPTITAKVYTGEEGAGTYNVMGLLYMATGLASAELVHTYDFGMVELEGSDKEEISKGVDLREYKDKANLFVKLLIYKNFGDLVGADANWVSLFEQGGAAIDELSYPESGATVSLSAYDKDNARARIVAVGTPDTVATLVVLKANESDYLLENVEYINNAKFDENGHTAFDILLPNAEGKQEYKYYMMSAAFLETLEGSITLGLGTLPTSYEYERIYLEDFEGGNPALPTWGDKISGAIESVEGEPFYKNVLRATMAEKHEGDGDIRTDTTVGFKIGDGLAISELPVDTYVETDFDFNFSHDTSGSNPGVQIALTNKNNDGDNHIKLDRGFQKISVGRGEQNSKVFDANTMLHMNIKMKVVNDSGTKKWAITSVKINDTENMNPVQAVIHGNDYSYIVMRFAAEPDGKIASPRMLLDNFSVITYTSPDGTSPAYDRYTYMKDLTEAYNTVANAGIDETKRDEMKADILGEIDAVFNNVSAIRADFDASARKIKGIAAEAEALAEMEANSTHIGEATIDAESFAYIDEVKATIPVYTTSEDSVSYKGLGVLIENGVDGLAGGVMRGEPQVATLNAEGELVFNFDLSGYTHEQRANMSVKVMAIKNVSDIFTTAPKSFSFGDEGDTINASDYSFVDAVNISTDKYKDTNNQKIVITAKGTAGKAVTAVIMKQGMDRNDLESSPMSRAMRSSVASNISYLNTAVFDRNGIAVFEHAPAEGRGDYVYAVVPEGGTHVTGTVYCSDRTEVTSAFSNLYAAYDVYKTDADAGTDAIEDTLDDEKMVLSVDTPVYQNASGTSIKIASVAADVLDMEADNYYNWDTFGEFSNRFTTRLGAVYSLNTVSSSDEVELKINEYKSVVPKSSDFIGLSTAKKRSAAADEIYEKRASIISLDTIESVVSTAVENANKIVEDDPINPGNPSGPSGPSSKPAGSISDGYMGGMESNGESAPVTTPMQNAQTLFNDIEDVSWAKTAIMEFSLNGWINGKGDGRFAPNDRITREEFVKIAVNVFDFYDEAVECSFADTGKNDWHYKYIASAFNAGLINGVQDGVFGTGNNISRSDMAVIIYRIIMKKQLELTHDGEYIPFADEELIGDYAKDAVIALTKSGIVNGTDNNCFAPSGSATRAEAVKMLYGAYKLK